MTMPSVLVTDMNIWIDLENGKILTEVFRLPYQFFTTDFAVEEYIRPSRQSHPENLGKTIPVFLLPNHTNSHAGRWLFEQG